MVNNIMGVVVKIDSAKLEEKTLQQAIWEVSPFIMRQIRQQADRTIMTDYEITRSQFHVLMQISHGHNTISSLANQDGVSLPAISRQVDELERKGILSRVRDPQDRRTVQLIITDEGRQIKETIRARVLEWLTERVNQLTAEEQETVFHGLDLLAKAFSDSTNDSMTCNDSK